MNSINPNFILKYLFLLIRKIFTVKLPNRNKIIVISLHKIGDSVFTIPAINYLYELYRKNLVVVCYPHSQSIYKLAIEDLNIITISSGSFLYNRFALPSARRIIKKLKPLKIFDLTGTITSFSLITGVKSEGLYGICDPAFVSGYTKSMLKYKYPPLTDLYLNAVKSLTGTNRDYDLFIKQSSALKEDYIFIHPFAGWKAKEWNLRKFISLAELISRDNRCAIISEFGLIDNDIKRYLLHNNITLIETGSIDELIAVIKKCRLFIGNDSGPVYIASLLGKPTFTIYGPTNPDYSMPKGNRHSYINKKLKCSPNGGHQYCFTNAGREGCPAFECMNSLSVTDVYNEIKFFIEKLSITDKGQYHLTNAEQIKR